MKNFLFHSKMKSIINNQNSQFIYIFFFFVFFFSKLRNNPTELNVANPQSIANANFTPHGDIKILIHGWLGSKSTTPNTVLIPGKNIFLLVYLIKTHKMRRQAYEREMHTDIFNKT